MKTNRNSFIGVFDSGVGGLTLLPALQFILPHEQFLYVSDDAHAPYGGKSKEEITIQRHFDCPLTTQQKKYKCRVQLLLQAYTAQALLTHNIEFLASPLPQAAQ